MDPNMYREGRHRKTGRREPSASQRDMPGTDPSPQLSEETILVDPLIVSFWPPVREKVNFCCVSPYFVVLCYGCTKKMKAEDVVSLILTFSIKLCNLKSVTSGLRWTNRPVQQNRISKVIRKAEVQI